MAFPPFGNSDHAAVSVSLDSLPNSKVDAQFYQFQIMNIIVLIGMIFVII